MAEMKQLIYTATVEGFRVWGKSLGLPYTLENGNTELYNTFSVPQRISYNVMTMGRENVPDVPRRCKYSFVDGGYMLMNTEYLGAELMNSQRSGNRFMHLYATDSPLGYLPITYFNSPGVFKTCLIGDEREMSNAPAPLPGADPIPDLSFTVLRVNALMQDEVNRRILAAMLCEVIGALLNGNTRLVFVKCGSGNRLLDWLSAVSLLLPYNLVSALTFDTACGTSNGRAPESFTMTDAVTGFIDGVDDGEFEACKVYGFDYKVYDMTSLSSTLGAMTAPAEITGAIDMLFSRETGAEPVRMLSAYRRLIDCSGATFSPALMLETASIAEDIIKIGNADTDRLINVRAACVAGRAESVTDDVAFLCEEAFRSGIEDLRELIDHTDSWNGLRAVIIKVMRNTVADKEYADALADSYIDVEGNAEAENKLRFFKEYGIAGDALNSMLAQRAAEYAEREAARIARGVIEKSSRELNEFIHAQSLDAVRVTRIISDAALEAVAPLLPQMAECYVCGETEENAEIFSKLESVQRFFKSKINERMSEAVSEYVRENARKLCAELVDVGRAAAVGEKLLRASEYSPDAKTVFSDALTAFLTEDVKGIQYADGVFRARTEREEGAEEQYGLLKEYTSPEQLEEIMRGCAVKYGCAKSAEIAVGILDGDEQSLRVYGELKEYKDDSVTGAVKLQIEKIAREKCKEYAARYPEDGAPGVEGLLERIGLFTDGEAVETCRQAFISDLRAALPDCKDRIVREYLDGNDTLTDKISVYFRDFRESLLTEWIGEHLEKDQSYFDGIIADTVAGQDVSERLARIRAVASDETVDRLRSEALRRFVSGKEMEIARGLLANEERSVRLYDHTAKDCSDAVGSIVDCIVSSLDEDIKEAALALFGGDPSGAEGLIDVVGKYAPTQIKRMRSEIYEATKAIVEERMPEIIGWMLDNNAARVDKIVENASKYGDGLSKVIGQGVSVWVKSEEGTERLSEIAKSLVLYESEADGVIAGLKKYAENTVAPCLRVIVNKGTPYFVPAVTEGIIKGDEKAYATYRQLVRYGEYESKKIIISSLINEMEKSFEDFARSIYESGDDSGIQEYIEVLEKKCCAVSDDVKRFKGDFESYLRQYVLDSEGNRLRGLAEKWIDDSPESEKIKNTILIHAPKVNGEQLRSAVIKVTDGLRITVIEKMASDDSYREYYARARRYAAFRNGYDKDYDVNCVLEALRIYGSSQEYCDGILDPLRRVAIAERLTFFYRGGEDVSTENGGYNLAVADEIRDILKKRLSKEDFLFGQEGGIEGAYGVMRADFAAIFGIADCMKAVIASYPRLEHERKKAVEAFVTGFIREAKAVGAKTAGDNPELVAYQKIRLEYQVRAILMEMVRSRLTREPQVITEYMKIYDITDEEGQELLMKINTPDAKEQVSRMMGEEGGDVVENFYKYCVKNDARAEEYYKDYVIPQTGAYIRFCILTDGAVSDDTATTLILTEFENQNNSFWDELCMEGLAEPSAAFSWMAALIGRLQSCEDMKDRLLRLFIRYYGIACIDFDKLMRQGGYTDEQKQRNMRFSFRIVHFYNALIGKKEVPRDNYKDLLQGEVRADDNDILQTFKITAVYMVAKERIQERNFGLLYDVLYKYEKRQTETKMCGSGTTVNDIFGFLYSDWYSEPLKEKESVNRFRQRWFDRQRKGGDDETVRIFALSEMLNRAVALLDDGKLDASELFGCASYEFSAQKLEQNAEGGEVCIAGDKWIEVKKLRKLSPSEMKYHDGIGADKLMLAVCRTPLPYGPENGKTRAMLMRNASCLLSSKNSTQRETAQAALDLLAKLDTVLSRRKGSGIDGGNNGYPSSEFAAFRRNLARRLALCSVKGDIGGFDFKEIGECFGDEYARAMVEFMHRSPKAEVDRCIQFVDSYGDGRYFRMLTFGLARFGKLNAKCKNAIRHYSDFNDTVK